MTAAKIDRAVGALHGTIAVLIAAGWTPEQVHAEVGRALKAAREFGASK